MRKTSTKMVEREEKIVEIHCDTCGKRISNGARHKICHMCKGDICGECVAHTEDAWTDYPNYYCLNCWKKGAKYREKIGQLEYEIESLQTEWERLCNPVKA